MTFLTRVDRQFMLRNWISRNLKPIKRFNMYYGDSRILLRLAKENDERLADIDHEEFKQAMARCGFYADTSYTDEHCTSLIYNVSTRSVKKLMENRRPDLLKPAMDTMNEELNDIMVNTSWLQEIQGTLGSGM